VITVCTEIPFGNIDQSLKHNHVHTCSIEKRKEKKEKFINFFMFNVIIVRENNVRRVIQ